MQQNHKENVVITAEMADEWGRLRPSAALRLTQAAAGHHCDTLGLDETVMAEKGLFWAIIRNTFTAVEMPRVGQMITLDTWPMPTSRTCYPRACIAYDAAGRELFACHSFWILMDRQTRAMVLPGKSGIHVPGILREHTPPAPKSLSPIAEGVWDCRQVSRVDLDQNGHMNNARYLDWAEDALGADFRRDKQLRRATLCYLNEAKLGQTLRFCMENAEENPVRFDLRRVKEDGGFDRIFSAELEYETVFM